MDNKLIDPWRFWTKVERRGTGCWEWTASLSNGYGYCQNYIFPLGRTHRIHAHRLSYILANGEIPKGMQIDHLCRNKICVNPEHLEVVTARENMRRGLAATKTHCVNGHEFTVENTRVDANEHRYCRACNRERVAAFYEKVGSTNPYKKARKALLT